MGRATFKVAPEFLVDLFSEGNRVTVTNPDGSSWGFDVIEAYPRNAKCLAMKADDRDISILIEHDELEGGEDLTVTCRSIEQ